MDVKKILGSERKQRRRCGEVLGGKYCTENKWATHRETIRHSGTCHSKDGRTRQAETQLCTSHLKEEQALF